jgi:hypothetical protein
VAIINKSVQDQGGQGRLITTRAAAGSNDARHLVAACCCFLLLARPPASPQMSVRLDAGLLPATHSPATLLPATLLAPPPESIAAAAQRRETSPSLRNAPPLSPGLVSPHLHWHWHLHLHLLALTRSLPPPLCDHPHGATLTTRSRHTLHATRQSPAAARTRTRTRFPISTLTASPALHCSSALSAHNDKRLAPSSCWARRPPTLPRPPPRLSHLAERR